MQYPPTPNAELDIKWRDGLRAAWSGGLGTTAVVAPAVQRPPLQLLSLIYIKLSALRFIVNLVFRLHTVQDDRNRVYFFAHGAHIKRFT